LTPHKALLFSASDGSELAQEVTPLRVCLLHPHTGCCHTSLPVGGVVPCLVEENIAPWWRGSVPGLQLLQGLLQVIEPLLYREQDVSQFRNLPPLPHECRGRMDGPGTGELPKIGLTLLACRGNLLFEFGNV
jgi:hypothetical protein